jgi:hypothetical protein
MKKITLLACILLANVMFANAWDNPKQTSPMEGDTIPHLFYIERSLNKNLVCYDVNYDKSGKIDEKNPIHVYWINRVDRVGEREELNFIQRKMAYGYNSKPNGDGTFKISLVPMSKRELSLKKNKGGEYYCEMTINGKSSQLKRLYVKTKPSNSNSVEYIIIYGVELATGKDVEEKVDN